MGVHAGFDMVPRLSKGTGDQRNWTEFIDAIKEKYKNDHQVEVKPNYIEFKAGDYPRLPFEGHKFLRFSSNVSMSNIRGVENYIRDVKSMANITFGSRIHPWHEAGDIRGYYDWAKVNDSFKSYKQVSLSCSEILRYFFLTSIQRDKPEDLDPNPDPNPNSNPATQEISPVDPNSKDDIPLFEIRDIPGKGKGLIARSDIKQGQRILIEKPLFTVRSLPSGKRLEEQIAIQLKALPKPSVQEFLSLHNSSPGQFPFSGILRTNALPCGAGSPIGAVYPNICLINHNCVSNSHHSWNDDLGCETIHAQRNIAAGEEITISYDDGNTYKQRRRKLKEAFGFECDCQRCSLPIPERKKSDANRLDIQRLDEKIGDQARLMMSPGSCLKDCQRLLSLLNTEYDGCALTLRARLYYDAFQITVTHSDEARASVFARKAYEMRALCEGEDSPQTKKVKRLSEDPSSHLSHGLTDQWETTTEQVPRGLDEEAFEKWLWRAG